MAKQLTYLQIIRNMIESHIDREVNSKSEHWPEIREIKLEKSDETTINWEASLRVDWHDYAMHGWMDAFGCVYISSVSYERMRVKDPEVKEWWKPENQKPFHGFVYGEALANFAYDE